MSELQTQALMSILGAKARKTGGTLRTVPREGVDVVTLPDGEHEVIYAGLGPKGVISLKGNKYQLRVPYGSEDGEIHSDLALAPLIEDTRETREFLDTFLTLQQKSVTARVIGFYLASFMCQLIRQTHNQFPLLQVYGEAGTGKTSFNSLCSSLHYYRRQPVVFSAAGITNYSLESLISSSASIPLLFDEFKPSEMDQRKAKNFLLTIRNNYNASVGGKGRLTKEAGRSGVIVARVSNAAPIVFLSEQRETQTAIVDRAISVPMDIKRAAKDAEGYNYCLARRSILGQWGHLCMQIALTLDIEELREAINQNIQVLQKSLGDAVASARPVFNNAVILTALEFGKGSLEKVFGDRYARIFDEFRDEVTGNIATSIPSNLSEPSKVISDLAHLSGRRSDDPFALELGLDYAPALDGAGEECVELHLKNCWDKYARFRRSQGATPLFDTEMSFIDAMLRHPAVVDRVCVTSPLKGARATVKVVRFSLRKLYAEPSLEEFAKLN